MHASQVSFDPDDMYATKPHERVVIIRLAVQQAPRWAVSAVVVNGWHTSLADPDEHCTVDYKNWRGDTRHRHHISRSDVGLPALEPTQSRTQSDAQPETQPDTQSDTQPGTQPTA
ncbi:hypothetical protein F5Y01DRAFT_311565 [Xylaria sp. FL0043]|nr:hypothetical protein F5Y01DRAFT_311565 [Xylaria sp. FL0043]